LPWQLIPGALWECSFSPAAAAGSKPNQFQTSSHFMFFQAHQLSFTPSFAFSIAGHLTPGAAGAALQIHKKTIKG
jgi:hypothetical protein